MTDLLLSSPPYIIKKEDEIHIDALCRALDMISAQKRGALYIHGNWDSLPTSFSRCLEEMDQRKLQATFCIDADDDLQLFKQAIADDSNVEIQVALRKDSAQRALQSLRQQKRVSFFLALPSPDLSFQVIDEALGAYPNPLKIALAVGWQNRLSGPAAIPADEYHIWSEKIVSLCEHISGRGLRIEFCCGLKLCMLSREQLGELAVKNVAWPIATCPRPFFFAADGSCQPCVRLTMPDGVAEQCGEDLKAAAAAIDDWLSPYLSLCYDSDTFDCRSLKVACCRTGCLEHTMDDWQS